MLFPQPTRLNKPMHPVLARKKCPGANEEQLHFEPVIKPKVDPADFAPKMRLLFHVLSAPDSHRMIAEPAVLILGATGRLGRVLVRHFTAAGLPVKALTRADLDLARPEGIATALAGASFDWLVNAAGTTDVDDCERHPRLAHVINAESTHELAIACADRGARMIHISTDYVFGGEGDHLLTEEDAAVPVNEYGASKLAGEKATLAASADHIVARVSWLFGGEKQSFPDRIVTAGIAGDEVRAVSDKWASPTYAEDLAGWLLFLVQSGAHRGLIHLCNSGVASWQEYGQAALDIAGELGLTLRTTHVEGHTMHGFDRFIAKRPPYTPLDTTRFAALRGSAPRPWQEALREYLTARYLR